MRNRVYSSTHQCYGYFEQQEEEQAHKAQLWGGGQLDYHKSIIDLPTHNSVDLAECFAERPPVDNQTVCVRSHDSD